MNYCNQETKLYTLLAASVLNFISADVYAQEKSAEVNVSVTVIGPVEKETRITDSSGTSCPWRRAAPESIEYYVPGLEGPASIDYYVNEGDYSWLDYTPPKIQQAESDAFYESLSGTENMAYVFPRLKRAFSKVKNAFDMLFFRDPVEEYDF